MAVMYASIHVDTTYVSHSVGVWNLPAPTDWTYVSPISIDHEDIRKGITKLTWAYRFDIAHPNDSVNVSFLSRFIMRNSRSIAF